MIFMRLIYYKVRKYANDCSLIVLDFNVNVKSGNKPPSSNDINELKIKLSEQHDVIVDHIVICNIMDLKED